MQDPLAIIGVAAILFPFLILGLAIGTGVIDTSVYRWMGEAIWLEWSTWWTQPCWVLCLVTHGRVVATFMVLWNNEVLMSEVYVDIACGVLISW